MKSTQGIRAFGLLLVSTSALSIATAASAQTEASQGTHFYNIPAQPLGTALNAYAEASGIDLVVAPEVVSGKRSHAVRGNLSADAALDQLLRGTSLSYRLSSAGSVIVETPGHAVQVSASAPLNAGIELAQNDTTQQPVPQATADQPAQEQAPPQAIVVTGVRASMQRARDIKKNSSGVVDAVSAEDIGKFPDTNLAESLQRIPGVSIERRNGEGDYVTVRGFGPEFNMVTINGRQLATTDVNVVGGDESVDFNQPSSRAFDFSNLSPDGISRLEVYKTGRASNPSGGIGATINIVTIRPLDGHQSGFRGSIAAKAQYDSSLKHLKVTPDLSGVLTWSNPANTFGVSVYGSYSKRLSQAASATTNGWTDIPYSKFLDPATGMYVPGVTQVNNAPSDPNELVAISDDSRYHFSTDREERINASATVQFKPTDTMTFTADGLYAQDRQREQRNDQTIWFNRPFDSVTFDSNPDVATAVMMHEVNSPFHDIDWEQQYRSSKTNLYSAGLNYKWEITPELTLNLDGNTSRSKSGPDSPNGTTSTLFNLGANVVTAHSVNWTGPIGQQNWLSSFNDCIATNNDPSGFNGNCDGKLDLGDLGTGVARTNTEGQTHRVNQFSADLAWNFGSGVRWDIGGTYIDSNMTSTKTQTQQILGNWGVQDTGIVQQMAANLVDTFCMQCEFSHFTATDAQTGFRGNAIDLYNVFSPYYLSVDQQNGTSQHQISVSHNFDQVHEKVTAVYTQLTWNGEIAGKDAQVVGGVRWENTKVDSTSLVTIPTAIRWESDNDFTFDNSSTLAPISGHGEYNNILPSIDFRINPSPGLVTRFSYSKTIARPNYGDLFASQSVAGAPNRPTALGGVATGNAGNPNLKPLESENLDLSLEYYYGRSNYVSVGLFAKRVNNFVGIAQIQEPLFGLTDPSSGAPGTLSGTALQMLKTGGYGISDVDLFTMTALLQANGGTSAAAQTAALNAFKAHYDASINQVNGDYANIILGQYDILGSANDPFEQFSVATPVNNHTGNIHGFELQGQQFFGDTGFGVAGSFTKVLGDVKFDPRSDPNANVFALTGLSDSANATLIYEKYGISARVSYNWRGRFLAGLNRGGSHNPVYFAPFGTVDASASYDINPQAQITFEAQNLTSTAIRTYARTTRELWFAQELHPRYWLGFRYKFQAAGMLPPPPPPAPLPPPPAAPATQTCADGTVVAATAACPVPPPPPAPAKPERG